MRIKGLTTRDIIGTFYNALEQAAGDWPTRLSMYVASDQESETYKWLGMAPALREWAGGRLARGLRENGITIENKTFEATIEADSNDARRDKTGQLRVRIAELAGRVAGHWKSLLSTLILNGAGATSGLAYDGQYFFDTDHSEGDSGAQKNVLTSTEVAALDVGTATAPTESEMSLAIMGVISYMLGYNDDRGEPMNEGASSFLVMTPPSLFGAAAGAIRSDFVGAASGAVKQNTLLKAGFSLDAVANPRLSAWTTDFCVFRTDGRAAPFIMQEELPAQFQILGAGSEHEFKTDQHLYGVKTVRNVGFGMWQYAAKCTMD